MASLIRQLRMDTFFDESPRRTQRRYTIVLPTNRAWEEAQRDFSKQYNTLIEGQFPGYGKAILERHFIISERPKTFEELVEVSRTSPRRVVDMVKGELIFSEQGEFDPNLRKEENS